MTTEDTTDGYSSWGVRRSLDGERLLGVFARLVQPLGESLPETSEIVLHDLSLLPNSIIAIHGNVTGRKIGDPATSLLLEKLSAKGHEDTFLNYESVLPDGRRLRSSTILIRDLAGNPAAALCINTDTSAWETIERVARAMLGPSSPDQAESPSPVSVSSDHHEAFVHDIDELAEVVLQRALVEAEVPVELMQKRHKIKVVQRLKEHGLFLLKDAVELTASALHVTRFTIYNYLNEIELEEAADNPGKTDAPTHGKASHEPR